MFFDEAFCHYGMEFRTWVINNNDHSFTYDKDNQTVHYNGKSEIYRQLNEGTYTYEEFDNMLIDSKWIGSYPLYAYEEYPSEHIQDAKQDQQPSNDIDWSKHNEQELEELEKKQLEEEFQIALESAEGE